MVTLQNIIDQLTYPSEMEEKRAIAKILLEDKYEVDKNLFLVTNEFSIPEDELAKDVSKLNSGIPIQQVVGFTYFMDHKFEVNETVLIPRPETEELVTILLNEFLPVDSEISLLDIGTGSGCIPISLKKALPNANVKAWDISPKALETATKNAILNNCIVTFEQVDILSHKEKSVQAFDLIVSNPPYVMDSEKLEMSEHVLSHEPHLALFVSDNDPLIFYSKISSYAFNNLKKGGLLAFEINSALGKETSRIVQDNGFEETELRQDIFGKDRFIFAKK
ncbi:release factor glutamine methyltransferase [Spirosomataceae bacterium TFI 002]|nr:release factor glutamine methyltransferase [Spirosomataceae bacterium TFI 002]